MKLIESTSHDNKFYYKFALLSGPEYTLTSVVNRLLNIDNFIIDYTRDYIQFNIKGYYFNLQTSDFANVFNKDIYAYIDTTFIDDGELDQTINDSCDSIECVQLIIAENLSDCYDVSKSLHLMHKVNNSWSICDNSRFSIDLSDHFSSDNIDDGEL